MSCRCVHDPTSSESVDLSDSFTSSAALGRGPRVVDNVVGLGYYEHTAQYQKEQYHSTPSRDQ